MYIIAANSRIRVEFIIPISFVMIAIDIMHSNIPIITDTNELVDCFTTSVSFSASNFGYFKFNIIPIK